MTKIPYKLVYHRSTGRSLTNFRNTLAFVFIISLVVVYVIWTSSGNSTTTASTSISSTSALLAIQGDHHQDKKNIINKFHGTTNTNKINKNHVNIAIGERSYLLIPPELSSESENYDNKIIAYDNKKHIKSKNLKKNEYVISNQVFKSNLLTTLMTAPTTTLLPPPPPKPFVFMQQKLFKNINSNLKKPSPQSPKSAPHSGKRAPPKNNDLTPINDTITICHENFEDTRKFVQNRPLEDYADQPVIYFVTPTYPRREQIPELIRLGQTLMHVPRIHWIVANDFKECNEVLDNLFARFEIPFTHLSSPMPEVYRAKTPGPRGVANRRAALTWLRSRNKQSGVLYFGDDDNTFDLKLFSEIRETKKVSMFPVGLIGLFAISSPVVRDGKVIAFFDSWPAKRKWPVDMAGFAINLQYLANHPNATMPYKAGFEEDAFLRSISLKINDIEPKANNCTEVLVWHTQTQKYKPPTVRIASKYLDPNKSNLGRLFIELDKMGVSHAGTEGIPSDLSRDGKSRPFSSYFR